MWQWSLRMCSYCDFCRRSNMSLCDRCSQCLVWQVVWDDSRSRGLHSSRLHGRLCHPALWKYSVLVWSPGMADKAHLSMCAVFQSGVTTVHFLLLLYFYLPNKRPVNTVTKYKTSKLLKGSHLPGLPYCWPVKTLPGQEDSGCASSPRLLTHWHLSDPGKAQSCLLQTQHLSVSHMQGCGRWTVSSSPWYNGCWPLLWIYVDQSCVFCRHRHCPKNQVSDTRSFQFCAPFSRSHHSALLSWVLCLS